MKENVLDVLMYLFENYMEDDSEMHPDRESLQVELQEAGFPNKEINKAFRWLESLASDQGGQEGVDSPADRSMRVYSPEERVRVDVDGQGFLLYLEQAGLLNAQQRELVLDRLLALETDEVDIEQVKWVVLMVMFNQPGEEHAQPWMEDLIFEDRLGEFH